MKLLYQESNKTLIARALKCLAESFTCKHSGSSELFTYKRIEDSKSVPAVRYHQPDNDSDGDHLFHPCLKNIKEEIDGGADTLSRKEELKKAIKVMKSEGFESSKIADHLQAANIPTIKGHPRWDGGTIRKWWR